MLKLKKQAGVLLLTGIIVLLVTIVPNNIMVHASATPSSAWSENTYLTAGRTPVWSHPTESYPSERIRILPALTPITIVEVFCPLFGNEVWGRTVNGTYVYMSNIGERKGVSPIPPAEFTATTIVRTPIRTTPAREGTIRCRWNVGRRVTVVSIYFNDRGHEWWTTSCGYEVYSGNFER
ncbi:MAG: hypothetical protein FWC16_04300 [Defluviitaleaceae bacterium]|nr:hypothetical protein [Defluviitaleaceae bacterium]MCL2274128.1 hypothetical protein [Defluviitaleaceae bacterium]